MSSNNMFDVFMMLFAILLGLLTEKHVQNFPDTVVITAAQDYLRVGG